jgi:hypothetical protein
MSNGAPFFTTGDSRAHFSVANTDFEGGENGRGCGNYIFLVLFAQSM